MFLPDTMLFRQYLEELRDLLKTQAIRRGRFTLASGQESDVYLDTRCVSLSARGSYLIGWLFHACLDANALLPDAVGGMALGAAPLVSAVLSQSAMAGQPIKAGFLVRAQTKAHGTQKVIEGPLQPWMQVMMLEDVVTSGGSLLKALDALARNYPNVTPQGILSLVNRSGESALTLQKRFGQPFLSLFSLSDLM
jgi:orotate phosphoribosyltransferase